MAFAVNLNRAQCFPAYVIPAMLATVIIWQIVKWVIPQKPNKDTWQISTLDHPAIAFRLRKHPSTATSRTTEHHLLHDSLTSFDLQLQPRNQEHKTENQVLVSRQLSREIVTSMFVEPDFR